MIPWPRRSVSANLQRMQMLKFWMKCLEARPTMVFERFKLFNA